MRRSGSNSHGGSHQRPQPKVGSDDGIKSGVPEDDRQTGGRHQKTTGKITLREHQTDAVHLACLFIFVQDTLRDEKEHHAMDMKDWKSKESAMKKRQDQGAKSLEVRMESMQSELHSLQSSHDNLQAELESSGQATAQLGAKVDRLQEEVSRCSSEKEALEQQMSHLAAERDSFKNQYLALFKQHQKSADSLQTLENEKSRLQLKLDDIKRTTSKDGGGPKASSSNPHQLREPMLVRALPASSSTRKSAVVNNRNLNIEQPFHPGHPAAVVSSSTPAAQSKVLAPVAAEPPLQRNVKPQQQLLRRHEVQKEDVMEAPQVLHHQEFNDFFHNSHGAALQQPLDRPQQQQQHFLPHQVLHHQQQHQAQQQHQGLFLRQQQHNFERPDAVRFQRREVDSIGRQQPPGDNLDEMIDGAKLAHPDLTGEEEEEEDDADDGQLQVPNMMIHVHARSI